MRLRLRYREDYESPRRRLNQQEQASPVMMSAAFASAPASAARGNFKAGWCYLDEAASLRGGFQLAERASPSDPSLFCGL
jgi:hypothetical protein